MSLPENRHLRQFLLFVFALIIPCFALWTVAADLVAMPVVGLTNMILGGWFPNTVDSIVFQNSDVYLLTQFGEAGGRPVPAEQSEYQFGFRINPAILSYSLPFYATLHFATQKDKYLGGFVSGVMVLYPFILFGLVSLCMKDLMVNLGALFMEQPGIFIPNGNVIGLFYQLNVLIVPTVAPIGVWAWQSRDTELFQSLLGPREATADEA
nr:exosortase H-associated membrane protein [Halioglobus maricola]